VKGEKSLKVKRVSGTFPLLPMTESYRTSLEKGEKRKERVPDTLSCLDFPAMPQSITGKQVHVNSF
jgi:hypothetical protein